MDGNLTSDSLIDKMMTGCTAAQHVLAGYRAPAWRCDEFRPKDHTRCKDISEGPSGMLTVTLSD